MPPTSIGGFRVMKEIARGAFSRVFMVQHPVQRKRYALKLLEDARDTVRVNGLRREFRFLSRMEHPRLPRVHRMGLSADGRPFTVMQLLPGENLRTLLRHRREWVLSVLPAIIKSVGDALEYIHSMGVAHCDLKPENVVTGPGGVSALVDFAGARGRWDWVRFWEKAPREASPSYISPEQAAGRRVGPATDIYAFGVMVFEMLAGRTPFTGTSVRELYKAHLSAAPPSLDKFLPGVDAGIARSVAQALNKDPSLRPGSAASWSRSIAAALQRAGPTTGALHGAGT